MGSLSDAEAFLGLRLKKLRELAGLSQEQAAERAGISFIYFQSIEAGRRTNLPLRTLESLAKSFGLELAEFFGKEVPAIRVLENVPPPPHKPRRVKKVNYLKSPAKKAAKGKKPKPKKN